MALNKQQIINSLNSANLSKASFWVVMGAALVLHGIKEHTNDIDLGCTEEYFNFLLSKGYEEKRSGRGMPKITYSDNISIYCGWRYSSLLLVDSIQVVSISDIIIDKTELKREKDLNDIYIIKRWLEEKGE